VVSDFRVAPKVLGILFDVMEWMLKISALFKI
jgi:hypothetical protein